MTHQEEALLYGVLKKNNISKSTSYQILHELKTAIYEAQCETEEPTISDLKEEARRNLFAAIDLLKFATEKYAAEALNSCDCAWADNLKGVARLVEDINWQAYAIEEAFMCRKGQEDEH